MDNNTSHINILYIMPGLGRYAPNIGVLLLIKYLLKLGIGIFVVSLKKDRPDSLRHDFNKIGIKIETLSTLNPYNLLTRLKHIIKQNKIDIVHTSTFTPDLIGIALKKISKDIRVISTVRSVPSTQLPMIYGKANGKILSLVTHSILKNIDFVVPHSKTIESSLLEKGLNPEKMTMIYNGVESNPWIDDRHELRTILRKDLGIPDDVVLVGHVGSHNKWKRIDIILKSLAMLEKDVWFISFGKGNKTKPLKKLSHDLGMDERVRWFGFTPDILRYYVIMDIFVLPSYSEGLSRALLEAAAAGLPLIVSDPSSREVVKEGKNGYIIPPGGIYELASCISRLKDAKLRKSFGQNSLSYAHEKFSALQMAYNYYELYQKIA